MQMVVIPCSSTIPNIYFVITHTVGKWSPTSYWLMWDWLAIAFKKKQSSHSKPAGNKLKIICEQ